MARRGESQNGTLHIFNEQEAPAVERQWIRESMEGNEDKDNRDTPWRDSGHHKHFTLSKMERMWAFEVD